MVARTKSGCEEGAVENEELRADVWASPLRPSFRPVFRQLRLPGLVGCGWASPPESKLT